MIEKIGQPQLHCDCCDEPITCTYEEHDDGSIVCKECDDDLAKCHSCGEYTRWSDCHKGRRGKVICTDCYSGIQCDAYEARRDRMLDF